MTQISHDDVQYLAQLSQLQLTDDEITHLEKDLSGIVAYIEQLSEVNTDGVEPTYQVTDLENVWREDRIDTYGVSEDDLLRLAPDSHDHQIKVPKVL